LGLTAEALWALTAREYAALKKIWELPRQHLDRRFAELQATLHNAWFRSKDSHPQPYLVEDFLPESQRTLPSIEEQKQAAAAKKMQMAMMFRAAGVKFRPLSERPTNG
jgi:hypothetical protein